MLSSLSVTVPCEQQLTVNSARARDHTQLKNSNKKIFSSCVCLSLSLSLFHTTSNTHIHIYTYIYIPVSPHTLTLCVIIALSFLPRTAVLMTTSTTTPTTAAVGNQSSLASLRSCWILKSGGGRHTYIHVWWWCIETSREREGERDFERERWCSFTEMPAKNKAMMHRQNK